MADLQTTNSNKDATQMEKLRRDPFCGLDSRRSWVVCGFSCWLILMATMSVRSSGVLYVAIMDFFHVSREEASLPLTLNIATTFIGGLVLGTVTEFWSCRWVLLVCTSVSSFAIGVCYFAPNLAFISFFFGALHGCCQSGLIVAVQVLLSKHFVRWRATACSLASASQCLNVFFSPQLTNYFKVRYGTPGMFLLNGAVGMNAVPVLLTVASPPWATRKNKEQPDTVAKMQLPEMEDLLNIYEGSRSCQQQSQDDNSLECPRTHGGHFKIEMTPSSSSAFLNCQRWVRSFCRVNSVVREVMRSFISWTFLVDSLSFALHIYSMSTFFLVHIDLPQDRGIEPSLAVYLIHVYSIADLVTRVLGGFVLDRGYISLQGIMILSFLGGTVASEAIAWSTSMIAFGLSSLLLGASGGLVVGTMSTVVMKDFKDRSLAMILGGARFIAGSFSMTRPWLVGYFRDQGGSYDGLYHTLAGANGLAAIIWIFRMLCFRPHREIAVL